MVHANCEIYTNENDELGVLIHTDPLAPYACSFLRGYDPEDYSINLDKRVIQFYLEKPNKRTYGEWNRFLRSLGYPELYLPMRRIFNRLESVDLDETAEGFDLVFVPKNVMFRIIGKPVFNDFAEYERDEQTVELFDGNDWLFFQCKEVLEESK
jgi:hypothetical protein